LAKAEAGEGKRESVTQLRKELGLAGT